MRIAERVLQAISRIYHSRLNDKFMRFLEYEYQEGTSLTKLMIYLQCYLDIVVSTK